MALAEPRLENRSRIQTNLFVQITQNYEDGVLHVCSTPEQEMTENFLPGSSYSIIEFLLTTVVYPVYEVDVLTHIPFREIREVTQTGSHSCRLVCIITSGGLLWEMTMIFHDERHLDLLFRRFHLGNVEFGGEQVMTGDMIDERARLAGDAEEKRMRIHTNLLL
jgi:hypothetical protein